MIFKRNISLLERLISEGWFQKKKALPKTLFENLTDEQVNQLYKSGTTIIFDKNEDKSYRIKIPLYKLGQLVDDDIIITEISQQI